MFKGRRRRKKGSVGEKKSQCEVFLMFAQCTGLTGRAPRDATWHVQQVARWTGRRIIEKSCRIPIKEQTKKKKENKEKTLPGLCMPLTLNLTENENWTLWICWKCTDLKNKTKGNDLWVILAKQMPEAQLRIASKKEMWTDDKLHSKDHEPSWLRFLRGSVPTVRTSGSFEWHDDIANPPLKRIRIVIERGQIEETRRIQHRELGRTIQARSRRCWPFVWLGFPKLIRGKQNYFFLDDEDGDMPKDQTKYSEREYEVVARTWRGIIAEGRHHWNRKNNLRRWIRYPTANE